MPKGIYDRDEVEQRRKDALNVIRYFVVNDDGTVHDRPFNTLRGALETRRRSQAQAKRDVPKKNHAYAWSPKARERSKLKWERIRSDRES